MKTKTENKKHVQRIVAGSVLAAGAGMMLYACAYDPSWDETATSPQETQAPKTNEPRSQNTAGDFAATVEELATPNGYQARLAWPKASGTDHFTVAREDLESGEIVQIMTLPPESSEFVDRSVKAGRKYRYHLGRHAQGAFAQREAEVAVPLDFVVSGAQVVNRVGPEFNRLWILPNSTLLTQGDDLSIEVNGIVAQDNAAIDSAPPGTWAAPNTPGKSGGSLHIQARTATGRLKVFATGQGGGQGSRGGDGAPGGRGPKGTPGTTRRERDGSTCERHCPSYTVCDRAPGNGGQGEQGHRGAQGGAGLPGGDSARVLIVVDSPENFEVIPAVSTGPGGPGGVGGNGGPGGPGGEPGDCPSVCNAARHGGSGSRGPQGATGAQGQPGNKQPVCMKLGGSLVGDCSAFEHMTQ